MAAAFANGSREDRDAETRQLQELQAITSFQNASESQKLNNGDLTIHAHHGTLPTLREETARKAYPAPLIPLVDRFIDEPRKLDVAIIGGGLSGIVAVILLRAKVPNIEPTIYEKNKDFVSFAMDHLGVLPTN